MQSIKCNRKYLLACLLFLLGQVNFAQDFYDMNAIQIIEITFAQSNWDDLLDAEKAGNEDYILAQNVTINGTTFDSVGVKYKGNSTYNANQTKNPFHIELDTYKDHEYDGYTDIKLSNVAKDPSFLREVLSYQILRQYMDAPLSNYAKVYVNGTLIGLYSNSESISKKFVDDRFGSKNNTFVKCNPPAGAGPQSNDLPNLVYLGTNSSNYDEAYELKSDEGWEELIDLCDTLSNHTTAIEQILDVDRTLWMLAFNNVLVNLDSYIGRFAQNYYLYRDDNHRFVPVVWDLNESFGRFSMTGSSNLNNTTAKQQLSPWLQLNDTNYPLIQKLLNIPLYKRMYLAHCKTILLENFDNNSYYDTAILLQELIDAAVQEDNNKFFTYNDFVNNLNADISGGGGPGGGTTPGITNLMVGRTNYLLGLTDFNYTEPSISNINLSSATPVINEALTLTVTIEQATTVYLGYRDDLDKKFTRTLLYDDGAHNDGAANDGIFGTTLIPTSAFGQYYIYAENEQAGKFSPVRAEYEYHSITATLSTPTVGDLVINEIMASNTTAVMDQDGEFDDWIELYNNSNTTIDLTGYFLSDDAEDLMQWQFPDGTMIDANGYLTIWADKDETQAGLHANFKLSAAAESLFLVNATGNIVDELSYANQTTDVSFGRYPNGTGNFQTMTPSFNQENTGGGTTSTLEYTVATSPFTLFPNPAKTSFTLEFHTNPTKVSNLSIYNLQGQLQYQAEVNGTTKVDVAHWPGGLYLVKIDQAFSKIIVQGSIK